MANKECNTCGKIKPLCCDFYLKARGYIGSVRISDYDSSCKKCTNKKRKQNGRTKKGLIQQRYNDQLSSSKTRGNKPPKYTKEELLIWALEQDIFHTLYNEWKKSGFKNELAPSFDRLDDTKRYNLKRLKVGTWLENRQKGYKDRKSGKNNKVSFSVFCIDEKGELFVFYSIRQASRITGVDPSSIIACCKRKYGAKTAGGFIWKYKRKRRK